MPAEDMTITAQWEIKRYKITFNNYDNLKLTDIEADHGTTPAYPGEIPVRNSEDPDYIYVFNGWSPEIVPATEAATYTARFEKVPVKDYTVIWLNGDNTILDQKTYTAGQTEPTTAGVPAKAATVQYTYTWTGEWTSAVDASGHIKTYTPKFTETVNQYTITFVDENGTTVTGDAQYSAQFTQTANEYTIAWVDGDGRVLSTVKLPYGAMPVYDGAEPTKASTEAYEYTFQGWSQQPATVTKDQTYIAQFQQKVRNYTVTFVDENGTTVLKSASYPYGTLAANIEKPKTPTKPSDTQYHYTFAGWTPAVVDVKGEALYRATYRVVLNDYTVTWKNEDGTTLKTDVRVKSGAIPVYSGATPTKAADAQYTYAFAGWTPSIMPVTGDVTYTATYSNTLNSYTVTWKNYDGTVLETDANVRYGDLPRFDGATPTRPREGGTIYTFAGWAPTVSLVTGNASYTAMYTTSGAPYSIHWVIKQLNYNVESKYDFGDKVVPPTNPVMTGYTFLGWKETSGAKTTAIPGTMPAENLTFEAQWQVNSYTITFDTDGGTPVNPVTQDYGTAIAKPANPTKTGYTFAGWEPALPTTMPAKSQTVKASWIVNQYTITFNTNGGSAIAPITQNYGTAVTAPGNPTRAGYTFAGWSPAVPTTMPAGNLTVVAQWTALPVYTVTVKTDGYGDASANITSGISGTKVELSYQPKKGYEFKAWKVVSGGVTIENNSFTIAGADVVVKATFRQVKTQANFTLLATMVSTGKNGLRFTWTNVKEADGYDIFWSKCLGKRSQYVLAKTVLQGQKRVYTVTKGLKANMSYKGYVRAWVKVDGKKVYFGDPSPAVHAYTNGGSRKITNPKKVTLLSPSKVTLEVGGQTTVQATVTGLDPSKETLVHAKELRFYTNNKSIASVDKKGVITGLTKGTCIVYVLANNGLRKSIKVTVK